MQQHKILSSQSPITNKWLVPDGSTIIFLLLSVDRILIGARGKPARTILSHRPERRILLALLHEDAPVSVESLAEVVA